MQLAKTTIDYKYLPNLITTLTNHRKVFMLHSGLMYDGDEVEVLVMTDQHWLDEVANICHGSMVISITCEDVWRVAEDNGYGQSISDNRYDAAEAVIQDAQGNLEQVWLAIDEALDAALNDYVVDETFPVSTGTP